VIEVDSIGMHGTWRSFRGIDRAIRRQETEARLDRSLAGVERQALPAVSSAARACVPRRKEPLAYFEEPTDGGSTARRLSRRAPGSG
jgi:hypothetical protein